MIGWLYCCFPGCEKVRTRAVVLGIVSGDDDDCVLFLEWEEAGKGKGVVVDGGDCDDECSKDL